MNYLFVIAIVGAAIMVVYSLVRGLIAFIQTNETTQNSDEVMAMHHKQNQMMFARVKWQAIVIFLLIALAGIAAGSGR